MKQAKKGQDGLGGERSVIPWGLCVLSALFALAAVPPDPSFCQASETGKPVATLGVNRVDITPDKPVLMSGYGARRTPSVGVHDELSASALCFSCDGTSALLITADLIGFSHAFVDEVKGRIAARTGIPPGNIMVSAVHNHGGPVIRTYEDSVPGPNDEYINVLKEKLVTLAADASRKAVPFRMGTAKGACRLNINRRALFAGGDIRLGRNPDGVCDHEVAVAKFEDLDGGQLAVLVNWPCHGTASGQDNYRITGDWPGAAVRTIGKLAGKDLVVAVTAGASGDINPIYGPGNDFDEIEAVGYHVGIEAWKALSAAETYPVHSVEAATAALTLPGKKAFPDRYPRVSYESGPDVEVRLTALKIGGLVLCGVSGELMNEMGLAVKARSPFAATMIVTHCNGSSGYICTDKAFSEGGYEVQVTRLMPGAEKPLVRRLLELIQSF
jgi:Neutral/alkaline non-lysosomal ceramidase, N-terminal